MEENYHEMFCDDCGMVFTYKLLLVNKALESQGQCYKLQTEHLWVVIKLGSLPHRHTFLCGKLPCDSGTSVER